MKYDPQKHHRRSIRLRNRDYAHPGTYYVTICTQNRIRRFGEIVKDDMQLNPIGQMVQSAWRKLPQRFLFVELDSYVIMPNHVHGILHLGMQSTTLDATKNRLIPLGQIIRTFKAVSTYHIHKSGNVDFAWQGNYYEEIIRKDGLNAVSTDPYLPTPLLVGRVRGPAPYNQYT